MPVAVWSATAGIMTPTKRDGYQALVGILAIASGVPLPQLSRGVKLNISSTAECVPLSVSWRSLQRCLCGFR